MGDWYVVVTNNQDRTLDLMKCSTREKAVEYVKTDLSNEEFTAKESGADCTIHIVQSIDDWSATLEVTINENGEWNLISYTWHICQAIDLG